MLMFYLKNRPYANDFLRESIASRLAHFRRLNGYTQSQLAYKLGLDGQKIAQYELGRIDLDAATIVRLCLTLHISADELLGLGHLEDPDEAGPPQADDERSQEVALEAAAEA